MTLARPHVESPPRRKSAFDAIKFDCRPFNPDEPHTPRSEADYDEVEALEAALQKVRELSPLLAAIVNTAQGGAQWAEDAYNENDLLEARIAVAIMDLED